MTPRVGHAPVRVDPGHPGMPAAWTLEVRWLIGDGPDACELVWTLRREATASCSSVAGANATAHAEVRGPGGLGRGLGTPIPVELAADESGPTVLLHADGPGLSLSVEIGLDGSARTLYARTDALRRLGVEGGRYDLGPATWREDPA